MEDAAARRALSLLGKHQRNSRAKKAHLRLAVRPQGREVSRFRQSPIAWFAAPSGRSFSKNSNQSPINAQIATTVDPARPTKNNVSRNSTKKCSIIWVPPTSQITDRKSVV